MAAPHEIAGAMQALAVSAIGTGEQVRARLQALVAQYRPDELMLVANIAGLQARKRSFELAMQAMRD